MKKLLLVAGVVALATALYAGSVGVQWTYPAGNPDVTRFRVYGVPGTNTTFTANNANATVILTVTNATAASASGFAAGPWTFCATALSTNGYESLNSTSIWKIVRPDQVVDFQFTP